MRVFRAVLDSARAKAHGVRSLGMGALGAVAVSLAFLASWDLGSFRSEVAVHPRTRLFPADPSGVVADALEPSARLSILFHPEPGRCAGEQVQTIQALRRLARDFEDVAIFSVLPENLEFGTIGGQRLPGEIVRTTAAAWTAANELSPRPRLEVWSADRRLLVLRSLPRTVSEEEIYEEVLWARSFTVPPAPSPSQ